MSTNMDDFLFSKRIERRVAIAPLLGLDGVKHYHAVVVAKNGQASFREKSRPYETVAPGSIEAPSSSSPITPLAILMIGFHGVALKRLDLG